MVMNTSRHAWLDVSHLLLEADNISVIIYCRQLIRSQATNVAMNAKKEPFTARRPFHLPSRHPQ